MLSTVRSISSHMMYIVFLLEDAGTRRCNADANTAADYAPLSATGYAVLRAVCDIPKLAILVSLHSVAAGNLQATVLQVAISLSAQGTAILGIQPPSQWRKTGLKCQLRSQRCLNDKLALSGIHPVSGFRDCWRFVDGLSYFTAADV